MGAVWWNAPRGASVFILINIMTAINLSQKMITEKDHERRESQRRVKPVIVALKGEKKKASDKELEKLCITCSGRSLQLLVRQELAML